ncbi:MAG: CvpA family protein [Flavobacteriales bacterium]|nr:CvpA family protein [Flavobacteriales bacterium]MCC6939103.1 CvpA family protein [Flavobacteriales bacterium]
MNWLDITLLIVLGFAALKGFQRGFIIELASVVGLVVGIWAGIHISEEVTEWLGLEIKQEAVAFLITFVLVLVLITLLARVLTKVIDITQLSLPNKLAGIVFGVVRSAFTLSIALNLIMGYSEGATPAQDVREASHLFTPIRAFAPTIIPAVEETKWMQPLRQELSGLGR